MLQQTSRLLTTVCPLFLFRCAGLPREALSALASPRTSSALEDLFAALAEMDRLADVVSNGLRDLIGVIAKDPASKREAALLIELRRDVHNQRVPVQGALDIAKMRLSGDDFDSLSLWSRALRLREQARQQLAPSIEADLEATRESLARWYAVTEFRHALQIANRQVEGRLSEYFSAIAAKKTSRKYRLIDDTLLAYFLRATTKTSPFSSFGLVGHGQWKDEEQALAPERCSTSHFITLSRLNCVLLSRLSAKVFQKQMAAGRAKLRLNRTIQQRGGRWHYLRARTKELARMAALGSTTSHSMFSLTVSRPIAELVDMLQSDGVATVDALAASLSRDESMTLDRARRVIERLLEMRFLEEAGPGHEAPYNTRMRHAIEAARDAGEREVEALLGQALDTSSALQTRDSGQRRRALAALFAAGDTLRDSSPHDDPKLENANVFYEDAAVTSQRPFALQRATEQGLLDCLSALQQLQPIFDYQAPLRAALHQYFKRRFPSGEPCLDVPRFAEEFARECAAPFRSVSGDDVPLGLFDRRFGMRDGAQVRSARQLLHARKRCLRYLRDVARASTAETADHHISFEQIRAIARSMPTTLHPVYSASLFMQRCPDVRGGPGWVLNSTYGGSGQLYSRFLDLWESLGDGTPTASLRAYIADSLCAGSMELPAGLDSNLNFHPPLAARRLEGDGTDACDTVFMKSLSIVLDPETDRLSLRSDEVPDLALTPLYLGGLSSRVLPDVQQLLLLFGMGSHVVLPQWQDLCGALAGASEQLTWYPRVTFSSIVLLRRAWAVPRSCIPERRQSAPDAEFIATFIAWIASTVLPRRGFASFGALDTPGGPRSKPTYVDFASVRSILMFEKELQRSGGVVWISEALPDPNPESYAGPGPEAANQLEYVFDLTTRARTETESR